MFDEYCVCGRAFLDHAPRTAHMRTCLVVQVLRERDKLKKSLARMVRLVDGDTELAGEGEAKEIIEEAKSLI